MKLPNTIISLIFNEIEEEKWIKLYFLFMDEIEWKINHHLKDVNIDYDKMKEECRNGKIFTILKNNPGDFWEAGYYEACYAGHLEVVKLMIKLGTFIHWNRGLWGGCIGNIFL